MHSFVPPPPPPAMGVRGNWQQPPPPPASRSSPLEVPVEWYLDIPQGSVPIVNSHISAIQEKFLTSISPLGEGEGQLAWCRYCIFGKPLAIHNTIVELKKLTQMAEVGYARDAPFPCGLDAPIDPLAEYMPVYHAAWVDYTLKSD